MKKLLELKRQRAAAIDRAKAILAKSKVEDLSDLSDEEIAEAEAANAEADGLAKEIAALEKKLNLVGAVNAASSSLAAPGEPRARGLGGSAAEAERVEVGAPNLLSDPRRGFANFGEFGQTIHAICDPSRRRADERIDLIQAATGSSMGEGASLGVLIPPQFSTAIWDRMQTNPNNLMELCDRYTVQGDSLTLIANKQSDDSDGTVYGGVLAYWLKEAGQMTGTKPKVRDLELKLNQLGVLIYATDRLLNNAVALEQYFEKAASAAIMHKVNDAIFEGDGAGKPYGFLNAPGTVVVSKESQQSADTIVKGNIDKMYSRMLSDFRDGALWFNNQDTEPQLEALAADVGTGGVPVYLPPGGYTEAPNARLKGRPVRALKYCSTVGDKGDIVFANLAAYALGIRGTIETAMSIHLRFDYNETAFRFLFEVDGQPWIDAPLTPFKGSNTLSPFVVLEAR